MKNHLPNENNVRIIKISEDALFEFLYEQFMEGLETYQEVDPLLVSNTYMMDWEKRQFIFCTYRDEDSEGNLIRFPDQIDLKKIIPAIPDTTTTMYRSDRYREYTKEELMALSANCD